MGDRNSSDNILKEELLKKKLELQQLLKQKQSSTTSLNKPKSGKISFRRTADIASVRDRKDVKSHADATEEKSFQQVHDSLKRKSLLYDQLSSSSKSRRDHADHEDDYMVDFDSKRRQRPSLQSDQDEDLVEIEDEFGRTRRDEFQNPKSVNMLISHRTWRTTIKSTRTTNDKTIACAHHLPICTISQLFQVIGNRISSISKNPLHNV